MTTLIIKKRKLTIENDTQFINTKNVLYNEKLFSFVWFLNDCQCEIIFWNEYIVKSSIGKLFIFPISWCFPYEEIGIINTEQYIITGFI